ncbi:hypothetical protein GCM10010967_05050 [Dyadobacter beijingensis]|uniref:Endonuclease GajA/Old nuclease/RecF-like AAA domain-containing protein n=1 Tax=Dyadobacter beijingensis TaxID=365489 RepID=A0ABQ2HDN5_9BACT|nr:AAA family ATPase [Dyadobacter beijingensis]GGM76411.1 hypothetical protein GCM10010967_05050 [Dyadobacter beijingensis]
MIVGLLVRNYKTYSGINYVPLTYGQNFCGLVGNNGIGKSSVLEALDSFFNAKNWNLNVITKRSGLTTTRPYIVPIFLIDKQDIGEENKPIAQTLSDYIWDLQESDIIGQNREQFKIFQDQLKIIQRNHTKENSFILPLGITYDQLPSLSIFNTRKLGEILSSDFDKSSQVIPDESLETFRSLLSELKNLFEYIYIPKDIDPENFLQLETKEIQSLMGETLNQIVEKYVPNTKIQEINSSLGVFIDSLSGMLEDYSFRTIGERQVNLRKHDVYKLIVEAYFKIRKLHKKEGSHWLEMSVLSSGEKQKAIIELAYHFLKRYRSETQKIILGIDEPESSLHMSACYDQFNKLFEVSILCKQLLFTTHWYGFIPTVEDGCVSVISRNDKGHFFDLVNVTSYREEVKQAISASKGKLPFDIRLKSINDFTQSVVTSILDNEPYNWLICEGSSEKIYFEAYLSDIKQEKKLRVIPVGGASEIKRIYNNLQVAYEDFKKDIRGKVVLLSDTDSELVQYPVRNDLKNLSCLRIVNKASEKNTILVNIDSNPVSPKTEIEDSLNGKLFFETLCEFRSNFSELENLLEGIDSVDETPTYFALDLSISKQKSLDQFFNSGNIKFEFAKKYVEKLTATYKTPEWIEQIKSMY